MNDDAAHGDDDLLARIAEGDRSAFRHLMERHTRAMLALAERITGNASDAEELVQEAFLKTWSMAPRWRPDGPARFSTWLYRVVLNACLDVKRRRPLAPLDDAVASTPDERTHGDGAENAVHRAIIRQALADLPERQRAVLGLYYFTGMTAPEAARALDLTLAATEALLLRGRRSLKAALKRRGVDGLEDIL